MTGVFLCNTFLLTYVSITDPKHGNGVTIAWAFHPC